MTFVWEISIGNLMTAILALITVVGFIWAIKTDVKLMIKAVEILGGRMINVENDIKAINVTLVEVARQEERLLAQDQRMSRLEKEIDELVTKLERHHD